MFLYLAAAVFFLITGVVYEMFSHQVYSAYMVFAFMIPLLLGVLPMALALLFRKRIPGRSPMQLYAGGVMMLTMTSVIKGILDIYGTNNSKLIIMLLTAVLMIVVAVIWGCLSMVIRLVRS